LKNRSCRNPESASFQVVTIYPLPAGPIPTNAYLLTAPERGEAILIDAPGDIWAEVEPILRRDKCRLTELWITHGHWDHTQGGAEVIRATHAKVRAHPGGRPLLESPAIMKAFAGQEFQLEPLAVDHWLADDEPLVGLGAPVSVRFVPGHCPGSVLFYFSKTGEAFVGDAIFKSSIGRTDLPGGNRAQLEKSIRTQIFTLPDTTVLYPGHGPTTTVAEEKATNPYVRP
jgi:glyoxylase-like metal-dependent hydrolase (beta-lactamase superfamily II)